MNAIDSHLHPVSRVSDRRLPGIVTLWLLLCSVFPGGANAAWPLDPTLALPICTAPDDQENPRIIPDEQGGAIISWTDRRLGYPRLAGCAQRVNASGTVLWTSNGVSLYLAGKEQSGPIAVSDGAGGAILFYTQSPGVDQFPDLYAQRLDATGARRWNPTGVVVASAPYGQYPSAVVTDGAGGAIVAWDDGRFDGFEVFVQRLSANGVPLWTVNGKAVTASVGSVATFIQMVPDGAGGALLAWVDGRNYFGAIYAQHIDAQGNALWASNGIPVISRLGGQDYPGIAADGTGGAIICWEDSRVYPANLYAQRLGADGSRKWAAEGIPVCPASGSQSKLRMIADGFGGTIVTWVDWRNGQNTSGDIYCQRLDASGLTQWDTNGVAVSAAPGYQFLPAIAPDNTGGAIITWGDQRNFNNDIFAQRIDAAGLPRWAQDGIPVALAPDDQTFPAITTDFAGGAFVVWQDRRNTANYDIYANRLTPPVANAGGNYSGKRDEPIVFNSTGSSDPAGDPLTFGWDFGDGSTATGPAPTHAYAADGVYTATLTVSDGLIAVSDAATVTIETDNPPDCSHARAVPNQLWPVDRRLVPITIAGVFDPDGDSVTLRVTRVTQDEPLVAAPSAVLGPDGTVALRADRLGNGNGRVYNIWFTATDSRGASTESSVQVGVPHDQGRNSCIDDGQKFISLQAR